MRALDKGPRTRKPGIKTPPLSRISFTTAMSKIRIANPQPGSARYTTASQAERYVRRKEAVIIDSELHFLSPIEQRRMQTFNRIFQSKRRANDVYVRGMVWHSVRSPKHKGFSHMTEALCSQQAYRKVAKAAFDAGTVWKTVYKAVCFARASYNVVMGTIQSPALLQNRSKGKISPHNILDPVQPTFFIPDLSVLWTQLDSGRMKSPHP